MTPKESSIVAPVLVLYTVCLVNMHLGAGAVP